MKTSNALATRRHTVMATPLGPLTLVADGSSLCGVYFDDQRHAPSRDHFGTRDDHDEILGSAREQLQAYFGGRLTLFDLPLGPSGSPFQHRVWAELRTIPYGETLSYGAIAARIGQPGAARAVGLANGRNPIGIIVPCHRVIGTNGSLTGYGGGIDRKRALLELEQRTGHLFT